MEGKRGRSGGAERGQGKERGGDSQCTIVARQEDAHGPGGVPRGGSEAEQEGWGEVRTVEA